MTRYDQRKLYFNNRLANLKRELNEEKLKPLMNKGDYNDNGKLQSPAKILTLTFFINRCLEGLQYTEKLNKQESNPSSNTKTNIIETRRNVNLMKKLTHCVKD